jgi:hypothetical protein
MFMAFASLVIAVSRIQSNTLTITRTNDVLTITAPKLGLTNNETMIITATYTKDGLPIADAVIFLYREGITEPLTYNITQADGTCALAYENMAFGTFKVWAEVEVS